MHCLISGATGFIGSRLSRELLAAGHRVTALSRSTAKVRRILGDKAGAVEWDYRHDSVPDEAWADVDTLIHLMGENVGAGRWTAARKQAIRDTRVESLRRLTANMPVTVRKVAIASAIHYYPDHPSRAYEESYRVTDAGSFLQQVCLDAETAAAAAAVQGRRVVPVRIGLVLGRGGILARLIPLFRLGLGGRVGHGRQWVSWIHVDDLVRLFVFVLENPQMDGPVNGVTSRPAPFREFARTLGQVLHRPAVLPAPAFAVRLVMGEAAELALASLRIMPGQAVANGFQYTHPDLAGALRDVWQKWRR